MDIAHENIAVRYALKRLIKTYIVDDQSFSPNAEAEHRMWELVKAEAIRLNLSTGNEYQPIAAKSSADILQTTCHLAALKSGWWHDLKTGESITKNPLCFSNKLMLVVSELAEAMEGDRKGLRDDKLPHRDMREVELADAVIRIFDLAGGFSMDLAGAIAEKLAYNAQRADHKIENRVMDGGKSY